MSEKMKFDYREFMNSELPSKEFLARLTKTLEEEEASKKRKEIRMIRQVSTAAACFVLLCGIAAVFYSKNKTKSDGGLSSDMSEYVGENDALETIPFENFDWYSENLTEESLLKALSQKMTEECDYIAYSDQNQFVDAPHMEKAEMQDITDMMVHAVRTNEEPEGEAVYYMAVFHDGSIAKFTIWDKTYIKIADDEKIYKKN